MPVAPRACIEDASRGIRQDISKGAVREITLDNDQILDGAVSHHLGKEAVRVRKSFSGFLPPEETLGDLFQVGHGGCLPDSSISLLYWKSPIFQDYPEILEVSSIARHQDSLMSTGQGCEQKIEIRDRFSNTMTFSP